MLCVWFFLTRIERDRQTIRQTDRQRDRETETERDI